MDEYGKIYKRKLKISAAAHLAAVALFFGANFLFAFFNGKKNGAPFDEIEFTVAVPAGVTGVAQSEPDPEPVAVPQPPPEPDPVPQPTLAKPNDIQISAVTSRVTAAPVVTTRPVAVPVAPAHQTLSETEVRKLMETGAKPGDRTSIPASEAQRCLLTIKNALYAAWKRPSAEHDTGRGTEITITIGASGTILKHDIARSSGNKTYDQSVVNAVADTARFPNLTPEFIKQYEKGVNILFELK